jgi:methylated-DNA-[protein]-cysteine S-methyltransferase
MSELTNVLKKGPTTTEPDATAFVKRATAARLVDVAYATADSPFGPLLVASTPAGLVRLAYPNERPDDVVDELAVRLSPRVLEAPARLDGVRRDLDEYFAGRRRRFRTRIDWALTSGFGRRVLEATAAIPFGRVSTYREIAAAAGSPNGSRAAGNALGANPIPIVVPCHRVLRTGGGLGGYTGGIDRKERLLAIEGVVSSP